MTGGKPLRPFEVGTDYLRDHVAEMVNATFSDLESQFLVLPKGKGYVEYRDFRDAYEVLKRHTAAFVNFNVDAVWSALREDSLSFVVLRAILGMTPPEWAEVARSDRKTDIDQTRARTLDRQCRIKRDYVAQLVARRRTATLDRIDALVTVAVDNIKQGAPAGADTVVHRLAKVDTAEGMASLRYVATQDVPYTMLLYERFLGRPFASHRDSVSGLIGEVMESAIEERLSRAGISYRKTRRAERVPGYDQAPDFFVPDEFAPAVLIEAKIAGDDGTARDKATRIVHLAEMRDKRLRDGQSGFEVVACIDGRGFGVRRADMERMLIATEGKVFTLATLDQLIQQTRLREFLPMPQGGGSE